MKGKQNTLVGSNHQFNAQSLVPIDQSKGSPMRPTPAFIHDKHLHARLNAQNRTAPALTAIQMDKQNRANPKFFVSRDAKALQQQINLHKQQV